MSTMSDEDIKRLFSDMGVKVRVESPGLRWLTQALRLIMLIGVWPFGIKIGVSGVMQVITTESIGYVQGLHIVTGIVAITCTIKAAINVFDRE